MHLRKSQKHCFFAFLILIFCTLFLGARFVYSEEYTSSSFKVLDPVMNAGGYGSSSTYRLFEALSQTADGLSTSLSFKDRAGFLYFPLMSTPSVSTTPGDGQVALSWSASTGYLGWTTSGYNIGESTASGGPYSYTSLGNVTSSTVTGLTNSTTYYFVVVVKDIFGNAVATSTEVYATPVASSGGGGGGWYPSGLGQIFGQDQSREREEAMVIISGETHPDGKVNVFSESGKILASTDTDSSGFFEVLISDISVGEHTFGAWSEDDRANRSIAKSVSAGVSRETKTYISGLVLPSTIASDRSDVKIGDKANIFGYTLPRVEVELVLKGPDGTETKRTLKTDRHGLWNFSFNTAGVLFGDYLVYTRFYKEDGKNIDSAKIRVNVGGKNKFIPFSPGVGYAGRGDFNEDRRVDLVDFSMLIYWYKKELPLNNEKILEIDLSKNGIVNLRDFSILAYYWTG